MLSVNCSSSKTLKMISTQGTKIRITWLITLTEVMFLSYIFQAFSFGTTFFYEKHGPPSKHFPRVSNDKPGATKWILCYLITVRNEVAKVISLHLSVILFIRGVLPQCMLGCHPPGPDPPGPGIPQEQTPPGPGTPWTRPPGPGTPHPRSRHSPRNRHPLGAGTPRPGTTGTTHTPPEQAHPPEQVPQEERQLLLRTVCILLECILVLIFFFPEKKSTPESWCKCVKYRLGTVNSKSFVGKVFLQIKQ